MVPFGTGVGDTVNMRPLLAAIARAHPTARVDALCFPSLAWLLPEGVSPTRSVHGVRPWRRLRPGGVPARLLARLSVPAAGRLLAPLVSVRTASWMTGYLRLQEYPVVINLLEELTRSDGIEARWTPGPRWPEPRHVIDLLAASLERRGVPVPAEERAPRLPRHPRRLHDGPVAIVNVHSGSTLKQAPAGMWRSVLAGLCELGMRTYLTSPPRELPAAHLISGLPGVRPLPAALPELVCLMAGASVVVSPDTGILHLAAAVGAPYVGLFGATDPRFCGPYPGGVGEAVEAPVEHPPVCVRCWRAQLLPAARCPLHAPESCLAMISPEMVLAAVERVITRGSGITPDGAISALESPPCDGAPKAARLHEGRAQGTHPAGEEDETKPPRSQ